MLGAASNKDWETPEELSLREPDRVREMHRDYVDAGADVLTTNSFGGNRIRLTRAGLADQLEAFNRSAAELAREVAGDKVLVAGDIGPSGEFLEPLGDHPYSEFVDAFAEQSRALAAGGVDFLLIETMSDLGEVRTAIEGAKSTGLGVVATMSFDTNKRTMMGVTPADAARAMVEYGADAVGANCGNSPDEMTDILREMREAMPDAVTLGQANAGIPEIRGGRVVYNSSPEEMAGHARQWAELGVQAIGACCGSTPETIRAIGEVVDRFRET
jgi:5-methyltetrahydrofolate--homocysteine methyltransferase